MYQQPLQGSQYQPPYQPPPPPQAYGGSFNNANANANANANSFPARMSTYSSNVIHDQGRPASYYGGGGPADGPPPRRPSRMSHHESVYSQSRHNGRAATHYGHLVSEEPRRNIMCGGDSCSACCKYNTLACLFCCNGWLRLCGCGMSIREILKFK